VNHTPRGNRLHIAIFGRRNAGKSSLINALTNQDIALVSDIAGTTTDPVYKSMEILPIGPVVIIDTAGIDDEGIIGELRIKKTKEVLNKTDLALIVTDNKVGIGHFEEELLQAIKEKAIPVVIVINKIDIHQSEVQINRNLPIVRVSALTELGIEQLKQAIIENAPKETEVPLVGDLIEREDMVVLVTPIDSSAPKGRMILPQVQVIRDILDNDGLMTVCKETELKEALESLKKPPKLVITDSQVFAQVSKIVPQDIPLTSFSILFARYKGDLKELVEGARAIKNLRPGDNVLIAEGCTHHRQDDDIGRAKIPKWLEKEAGGKLNFEWVSGNGFQENLSKYKLIVHCGACMQNRREMMSRINMAKSFNVPIVNYGVFISYVTKISDRVLQPFGMKI
jgi:[FeFe] hydrogenase H-cluster maturation GTPase HydF